MRNNQFVESFLETLLAKFVDDTSRISTSEWICEHTTLRKRPFSFKGYEFQRAIADDWHPSLYVIKCSQVGLTETQLRKYLAFLTRHQGTTGIFTLPNEEMFERVSKTRARPIVENDEIFNKTEQKQLRSVGIYQIGDSFAYFTGMTEGDATSIPADIIFHDELDLSRQEMIGLYQSRLQNSVYKITQSFSTPKFTGFGVHKGFMSSDQHEYMIRCESCNHWNIPAFDKKHVHLPGLSDETALMDITVDEAVKIDFREAAVVCEKCRTPLDLGNPELREWVARHPGRLNRGYRVTPFCTDRLTLDYIIRQLIRMRDLDQIAGFYNTVLGEPFDSVNARLTESQIRACFVSPSSPDLDGEEVFIGIDMGQMCHVVVGRPDHVFRFETVPSDEIVEWVKAAERRWNIVGGAVDRHPYTPTANEIREATNGRILPVEYRGTILANPKKDEFQTITHVQAARTAVIDLVKNAIQGRKISISGFGSQDRLLIDQLRDMVRIEQPEKEARWQKLTGNDHYFHALAFFMLSQRIANVLHFKSDSDDRTVLEIGSIEDFHHSSPSLSVKSRMRTPMSLRTN